MKLCKKHELDMTGRVTVSTGWIFSAKEAQEEQKGWDELDEQAKIDFSTDSFWHLPIGEGSPVPLTEQEVEDLITEQEGSR